MDFSREEKILLINLYRKILSRLGDSIKTNQLRKIKEILSNAVKNNVLIKTNPNINPIIRNMQTAFILCNDMGLKHSSIISSMLYDVVRAGYYTTDQAEKDFDLSTRNILEGLTKAKELYSRNAIIATENFRNLLLSFAKDGRVILIMIADCQNTMRLLKFYPEKEQIKIARESSFLFAPLAHRMGLYGIKTEIEDLSMRYLYPTIYYEIAKKLAETKRARDKYIHDFIEPVKKRIEDTTGLKFSIKGRTKSINSIWNKLKKQKIKFEDIYDLFAIRVIIDTEEENEKSACWQVYSIITDMYTPNTNRLKDWISIPKTNGYESLHITVMGNQGKWVEVQIRTKRMDLVAEKGIAAHWRYKGIKSESGLDLMLTKIREILENKESTSIDLVDNFKLNLYENEVYVFSPKGEVYKLPVGATVLDFAYSIHSKLGDKCTGAKVDNRIVPIRYKLENGNQIEIQTNSNQYPKQDWLKFVVTSKAKSRIRQALKEEEKKQAEFGRDILFRRLKNRKIEYNEGVMMRIIKKLKFDTLTYFYASLADEKIDINLIIDVYQKHLKEVTEDSAPEQISAENYKVERIEEEKNDDILVIDKNLSGIEYSFAKCCNPIYGDDIFGFVSVSGGIKIHRKDCPNAPEMNRRFGYRIVKARWTGDGLKANFPVTIQVIGKDDIDIVTTITAFISKEENVSLRSININSNDGLFKGQITILVKSQNQLKSLIKKISMLSGVKDVSRTI